MEIFTNKKEGFVCPNCENDDNVETTEYSTEFDTDGMLVGIHCYCTKCESSFIDWYKTKYDGFTASEGVFNADGKKVCD